MSKLGQRIILVVVLLAIVVVLAVWWWQRGINQANLAAVSEALNQSSATANEPVAVTVADQFPGIAIFVSSVTLPHGGWVVIAREAGNAPGAIVGAGYFDVGVVTGEVNLATATHEGEHYWAVLYRDGGDLKFDPKADAIYRDANNQIVAVPFAITKNLPESKG